jgi:hypothetical protein
MELNEKFRQNPTDQVRTGSTECIHIATAFYCLLHVQLSSVVHEIIERNIDHYLSRITVWSCVPYMCAFCAHRCSHGFRQSTTSSVLTYLLAFLYTGPIEMGSATYNRCHRRKFGYGRPCKVSAVSCRLCCCGVLLLTTCPTFQVWHMRLLSAILTPT